MGIASATNFARNGVADWLVQRATAYILLGYTLCIAAFICCNTGALNYEAWSGFMMSLPMRIFSSVSIFAILAHAWIGMWTISTDYITDRLMGMRGTVLRILFQFVIGLVLGVYLLWALSIFWG